MAYKFCGLNREENQFSTKRVIAIGSARKIRKENVLMLKRHIARESIGGL